MNANTVVHGSIRLHDRSSGDDPKDVKLYGNIACNSLSPGFPIDSDFGYSNTLRVYNNAFYNNLVVSAPPFPVFEFIGAYEFSGTAPSPPARTSLRIVS